MLRLPRKFRTVSEDPIRPRRLGHLPRWERGRSFLASKWHPRLVVGVECVRLAYAAIRFRFGSTAYRLAATSRMASLKSVRVSSFQPLPATELRALSSEV